jgi:hypothetical protein
MTLKHLVISFSLVFYFYLLTTFNFFLTHEYFYSNFPVALLSFAIGVFTLCYSVYGTYLLVGDIRSYLRQSR